MHFMYLKNMPFVLAVIMRIKVFSDRETFVLSYDMPLLLLIAHFHL